MDALLAAIGSWTGTYSLWLSDEGPPDESPSTVVVTALPDGPSIRLDQTWAWRGAPQTGSMRIGHDPQTRATTVHWIDTFHTPKGAMTFAGGTADDGPLDVRGTYAAGSGPAWGWRITIATPAPDRLDVVMMNITPAGEEQLAVQATYARP